jgi:hypothetical protein
MNENIFNKNRVLFFPKDTHWAFIWWYTCEESIKEALCYLNKNRDEVVFNIRVYRYLTWFDSQEKNLIQADIEVRQFTDNWYLWLPNEGIDFYSEVGLKSANGVFKSIARSNVLKLPPDGPGQSTSVEWMTKAILF